MARANLGDDMQDYNSEKKLLCKVINNLWDRRLTNASGGNLSIRLSDSEILITPTLMAENKFCDLTEEDLLIINYDEEILHGNGGLSRETQMHIELYKEFDSVNAVIHAHPFNCMPFAAFERPIESLTEATCNHGAVELIEIAEMCTPQLTANVVSYFKDKRDLLKNLAVAGIMPKHGLVVAGQDINKVYAYLECIECDAFCALSYNNVKSFFNEK